MNQYFDKTEHPFTGIPHIAKDKEICGYDVYDKLPSITYAKGTIRRLIVSDGRQVTEDPLGFGFIITSCS